MDLENVENQIKKADSLMDTGWNFFKKHWWKLLILGVMYFFYWAFTTDFEEETADDTVDDAYIIETYKELGSTGDTLTIEVWSDGVETIAE